MHKDSQCFVCATDSHGFYEAALNLLRATAHRITKPREILLKVLSNLEQPKTPTELFEMVLSELMSSRQQAGTKEPNRDTPDKILIEKVSIDKVTVYRMLQAFEALGIVHQTRQNEYFKCSLTTAQSPSSDHATHQAEHYHIIMKCERCNATSIARPPTNLINNLKEFLQENHFTLTSDVIEVSGMCAACRQEP